MFAVEKGAGGGEAACCDLKLILPVATGFSMEPGCTTSKDVPEVMERKCSVEDKGTRILGRNWQCGYPQKTPPPAGHPAEIGLE